MRSDLGAVEGVYDVETDVSEQTCKFRYSPKLNLEETLKKLAKENNKMADFEILGGGSQD